MSDPDDYLAREFEMTNVSKFPTLSMPLVSLEPLPDGTRYECKAPDWIVRKTTDDGKTWEELGRLDPPKKPTVTR